MPKQPKTPNPSSRANPYPGVTKPLKSGGIESPSYVDPDSVCKILFLGRDEGLSFYQETVFQVEDLYPLRRYLENGGVFVLSQCRIFQL